MEFWRAELLIEIHKEKTEEENKQRKKQEEAESSQMPNMGSFMSQQQNMFKGLSSGGGGFNPANFKI